MFKEQSIGEANKYFHIFTKDFGMVGATAQGIRLLKSKLRYSLQEYSYSKISLVRGKHVWRIVGAVKENDFYVSLKEDKGKFELLVRIFSLLLRLVRGEEKNEILFKIIHSSSEFLKNQDLDDSQLKSFEYLSIMKILHSLGYMDESMYFKKFLFSDVWTKDVISKISPLRHHMVPLINRALKETHL